DNKQIARRVLRTKPHVNYEAGDRTKRLPNVIDLDYAKFIEAYNAGSPAKPDTKATKETAK
ncbi:MAG: ATP-binding protein, partial [Armatimonadota bacterium]